MENKYVVLYFDTYSGFKRKVVRSYDSWNMVVNTITSRLSIAESQIISISLDTNVPIEEN